jgi:hypothetical protein
VSHVIIFIQRVAPVGEQPSLYLVAARHNCASNKCIPLITRQSGLKKSDCVRGVTVEAREGIAGRLYIVHRAHYVPHMTCCAWCPGVLDLGRDGIGFPKLNSFVENIKNDMHWDRRCSLKSSKRKFKAVPKYVSIVAYVWGEMHTFGGRSTYIRLDRIYFSATRVSSGARQITSTLYRLLMVFIKILWPHTHMINTVFINLVEHFQSNSMGKWPGIVGKRRPGRGDHDLLAVVNTATCLVTADGVWIGNPIYWTLETRNYNVQFTITQTVLHSRH